MSILAVDVAWKRLNIIVSQHRPNHDDILECQKCSGGAEMDGRKKFGVRTSGLDVRLGICGVDVGIELRRRR